jgi:hypothetical protein
MDNRWGLNDLYDFPHALAQTYAFAYCFESNLSPRDAQRIDRALRSYPWRGGYSIVNIYVVLQNQVPPRFRPQVKSIHYASPGWIDLILNLDAIEKVAEAVAAIGVSSLAAAKAYKSIQKTLHDIKMQKEKSKLESLRVSRGQVVALRSLCDELSKLLGFKKFDELLERTGDDEEVAAKLLSAQYRRLETIAEYVDNGQVVLPHKSTKTR